MGKPVCIYHGPGCADGFAAATVAWTYYSGYVDMVAANYGDAAPSVADRDVIIVDFSYPRDVLERMALEARSLLVLDHHKTAQANLEGLRLPNTRIVFDMDRSGAKMAWDEFYPENRTPRLIKSVQLRDLWRHRDGDGVAETHAALMSHPADFPTWSAFLLNDGLIPSLEKDGEAILRAHKKLIADATDPKSGQILRMMIGGVFVPALNCPYAWASDVGNILCKGQPFAATFLHNGTGWKVSLRSEGERGMDVSKVAAVYGGGGHRNAAGFTVSDLEDLFPRHGQMTDKAE